MQILCSYQLIKLIQNMTEFPSSQKKGEEVKITLILHISEKPTKNKIYVM